MKTVVCTLLLAGLLLPACTQDNKAAHENVSTPDEDTTMLKEETSMYQTLSSYIQEVEKDTAAIPAERKALLTEAAHYIVSKNKGGEAAKMVFICTHNSRRSHMSQLWAATMAAYLGKPDMVVSYSGGTEATAFNLRAVAAMRAAGFQIQSEGGDNPVYKVQYGSNSPEMLCYSKKYDAPENPQAGFAAIMTCSDADEACPIVQGAETRVPITYEDPKAFDGTDREAEAYAERCRQIATEMLYMIGKAYSGSSTS